jgi:membrane protein YdbS with pleckstrin-like domain
MPYPDNLLSRGEEVVLHKHPHWKSLIPPVFFFIVLIGGGFAVAALLRNWQYRGIAWIAIAVIVVVLLIWLVIAPFLRWRTEHFVLTTRHVFFRTGIVKRREHQIPLSRIQNIETVVTFWGRMLGYGSLIVDSAADQPLEFPNVASVHKVQGLLNQLIADDRAHEGDDYGDGTVPPRSRGAGQPDQPNPTQAYPTESYPTRGRPSPTEPTQSVPPPGTPGQPA